MPGEIFDKFVEDIFIKFTHRINNYRYILIETHFKNFHER